MPLWGSSPRVKREVSPEPRKKYRKGRDDHEPRDRSRDPGRKTSSSYHSSSSSSRSRRRVYDTDPKTHRSGPYSESRSSLPYPKFSKAHSREALGREDASSQERRQPTPERTDIGTDASPSRYAESTPWSKGNAPPSPPLTASGSLHPVQTRRSQKKRSETSPGKKLRFSASRLSLRDAEEGKSSSNNSRRSSQQQPRVEDSHANETSPMRRPSESAKVSQAGTAIAASDATSVPTSRKRVSKTPTLLSHRGPSPESDHESQPRTPANQDDAFLDVAEGRKATPVIEVFATEGSQSDVGEGTVEPGDGSLPGPPPPPPPPPGIVPTEIPRVDYLLQNGGLPQQLPRTFPGALKRPPPVSYQQYVPMPSTASRNTDMHQIFSPFRELLENYEKVISKNGSIAVATGYKSVARRLLDRLETVFSRNISSEICGCVICKLDRASYLYNADRDSGVSWGEVLELVSGRRELPAWPPFAMPTTSSGLAIDGLKHEAPMQKLDIDVPEEYRDHYIRQSKKTKQSVDKWLASQPEEHASPPTEVDDETLTFAMLTYLEPEQRRVFTALIRNLPNLPDPRAATPAPMTPKPDTMPKAAAAIQRLYHLPNVPREPECALYLLKNPSIHSALATLAAISNDEWEILVSGRFDGFLVSGAETRFPSMGPVPSRGTTPFSKTPAVSRGPTPFRSTPSRGPTATPIRNGTPGPSSSQPPQAPGPVQMDEETEIAVLAEVEREIYLGMDALEDAMEALHLKAEQVRNALRERSAGLSLQAQRRKSVGEELRAVVGTPFVGGEHDRSGTGTPTQIYRNGTPGAVRGNGLGWDMEDGLMDDTASLAPDDSASNIGMKERRHRHRRRRPRRVEAVEEGSEI